METALDAVVEVTAGGRIVGPLASDGSSSSFHVQVDEAGDLVAVRATRRGVEASWRLGLEPVAELPWLSTATERLRSGDLDGAESEARRYESAADPAERGAASSVLGQIAIARGASDAAATRLSAAIAEFRAAGRMLDEVRAAAILAHLRIAARDFVGARRILASLPARPTGFAEADYYLAYYHGVLAEEVGDLGRALAMTREAVEVAARAGLERERLLAEQVEAGQLQLVGRAGDAAALFARLDRESGELRPCERAHLANNSAWALLLAREAGHPSPRDPAPLLEETLKAFSGLCRTSGVELDNVRVNLALARLQDGDPAAARRTLLDLSAEEGPRLRLWVTEIEARLALAEGDAPGALRSYEELAALAMATRAPEASWRAAVGRAAVLADQGDLERALDSFAAAEALLDEHSLRVPFLEGRDTFVAQRERGTLLHLDLLLASGRPAEALDAARRARSRILRGLGTEARVASLGPEEQAIWDAAAAEYRGLREQIELATARLWQAPLDRRAAAEKRIAGEEELVRAALERALSVIGGDPMDPALAAPTDGELLLAFHPLPEGWAGFARLADRVLARRLDCVDRSAAPEALAACLLEPFAAAIDAAERIRILPYGSLQDVDLHALPWRGAPLIAARPVTYGLDLERRPPPVAAAAAAAGRATVAADPRGDLPSARDEARDVARLLASAGLELEILEGPAAVGEALRGALPDAALFHYAGHAVFAGRSGWESALPLAEGSALTVGDVLALPAVPALVFLAGCETGRASRDAPAPGLGLAHAFASAGAAAVVAATRPVADREARLMSVAFYRHWGGGEEPAQALRAAQLELRARAPQADWASFRLVEP